MKESRCRQVAGRVMSDEGEMLRSKVALQAVSGLREPRPWGAQVRG